MIEFEDVFVWTKIGHDAGEVLGGILARKDAERRAGTFWWGIGSSLDREKLKRALTACGGILPVLFSEQLSRPKKEKSSGSRRMTLWTHWVDETGSYEIPDHALVIGNGPSEREISKGHSQHYYALVCESDNSIATLRDHPFDDQKFRNYPDGARPGNSQNTALLTGNMKADHTHGRYKKGFSATLVRPWLVTLAGPRLLTSEEQNQITRWNGEDHSGLVRRIRK
jgi:hypothetical protein